MDGCNSGRSILIATMGTRGDVAPFLALSLGLAARGWSVTMAAPPEYREIIEGHGVAWAEVGRSLQSEVYGTERGRVLRTAGPAQVLAATRAFFSVDLFESWCALM